MLPHGAHLRHEHITLLPFELCKHVLLDVSLNKADEAVENLRTHILIVALVDDQLVDLCELGVAAHVPSFAPQEPEKFAHKICVDDFVHLSDVDRFDVAVHAEAH